MTPWLHIIGIGEDGLDGLTPPTRALLESAEIIIGGDRHHNLSDKIKAERIAWPSPFDAMIETIRAQKGKRVVILVTGDPLWYSVGARITKAIAPAEIIFHPQLSAFQLAAARLGWSLADLDTLTVHGRATEQMIPFIQLGARLLILTTGAKTPAQIAGFLTERGFGDSAMTVMSAMGGPDEKRFNGIAKSWAHEVPEFNTLAVECIANADAPLLPQIPGLPDNAFRHDGNMTKREVRAITLAKLMPMRGAMLWDVGCGCGSVAIEWMRAARDARAIGIEPRADRRAFAAENALNLGTPSLHLVAGTAPDALQGLPRPDAVFIGGGVAQNTIIGCMSVLRPLGRVVVNAVTLESEAVLLACHTEFGGDLARLSVQRAEPIGGLTGWKPQMTVTQWSCVKR